MLIFKIKISFWRKICDQQLFVISTLIKEYCDVMQVVLFPVWLFYLSMVAITVSASFCALARKWISILLYKSRNYKIKEECIHMKFVLCSTCHLHLIYITEWYPTIQWIPEGLLYSCGLSRPMYFTYLSHRDVPFLAERAEVSWWPQLHVAAALPGVQLAARDWTQLAWLETLRVRGGGECVRHQSGCVFQSHRAVLTLICMCVTTCVHMFLYT